MAALRCRGESLWLKVDSLVLAGHTLFGRLQLKATKVSRGSQKWGFNSRSTMSPAAPCTASAKLFTTSTRTPCTVHPWPSARDFARQKQLSQLLLLLLLPLLLPLLHLQQLTPPLRQLLAAYDTAAVPEEKPGCS